MSYDEIYLFVLHCRKFCAKIQYVKTFIYKPSPRKATVETALIRVRCGSKSPRNKSVTRELSKDWSSSLSSGTPAH